MLFNPRHVQAAFNRAAPYYDNAAVLAREVGDRLLEQFDYIKSQPITILDLGGGTGYLTQHLQARFPTATIISVDIAEHMLRQTTNSSQRVCGDAMQLPFADNSIDLVVSNLLLPWCNQPEKVFEEVQRVLKSSGLFLFSMFGPDTLGELRASWASVDEAPHVHLFFDLHDIGDALVRSGLSDPVMQTEWLTFTYPNWQALHRELKHTASINLLQDRRMTLTGKQRGQRFLNELETYRDSEGRLPATFELIYGHCWKLKQRQTTAGEFHINIAEIKRR